MHLPQFLQEDSAHPVPLPEEDSDGEEVPTVSFPIGRTLKEIEQMYILETLEVDGQASCQNSECLGHKCADPEEQVKKL